MNGSTMLNLSLITCDMWAILLQKFSYHQKIGTLYFVSFSMVGLGLIIYTSFTKHPQANLMQDEGAIGDEATKWAKKIVNMEIKV